MTSVSTNLNVLESAYSKARETPVDDIVITVDWSKAGKYMALFLSGNKHQGDSFFIVAGRCN